MHKDAGYDNAAFLEDNMHLNKCTRLNRSLVKEAERLEQDGIDHT